MYRNIATLVESHNSSQLAIGDAQVFRRRCELDQVALSKLAFCFAVDRDSLQAAQVIGHSLAGLTLHSEQVLFGVRRCDGGYFPALTPATLLPRE